MPASSLGGATPTLYVITATLPATPVPSITFTPIPPTPSPTIQPIPGMTTTQVNVRGEPSPAGRQLGLLGPFVNVQIVGKNAAGDWYVINYSGVPEGLGWVAAQYINVQNKDSIPVIGAPDDTATPPALTGTPAASGTITQQVNVRKGPGTTFDAVGTLNPKDTAALTGKDTSGSWVQIQFPGGPNGKGWIAAAYIQAASIQALPVVESGTTVFSTAHATAVTVTVVTATPVAVAHEDGDSLAAPATNVTLSPGGTRVLIYSSDVSAPHGDAQDYVEFTTTSSIVLAALDCTGNGSLQARLLANGSPLTDSPGLACGKTSMLQLAPGQVYVFVLSLTPGAASASYIDYTISVMIAS